MNKKIIFGQNVIENKIKVLGQQISNDYSKCNKDILMVCVLNGALMFFSDLIKNIDCDVFIDTMQVSSYGDSSVSNGDPKIVKDCSIDIKDKHIIIVDDIIDTGTTLKFLKEYFLDKGAVSVKIAALLDKNNCPDLGDYVCFDCPKGFIVGYGLDYAQHYRQYPYIAELDGI